MFAFRPICEDARPDECGCQYAYGISSDICFKKPQGKTKSVEYEGYISKFNRHWNIINGIFENGVSGEYPFLTFNVTYINNRVMGTDVTFNVSGPEDAVDAFDRIMNVLLKS